MLKIAPEEEGVTEIGELGLVPVEVQIRCSVAPPRDGSK